MDLGDRAKALEPLKVNRLAHAAIVGVVKDVLPETQVGCLGGTRQWPCCRPHGPDPRPWGTGLLAAHRLIFSG
ncbi:hypothetical protein ACFWSF_25885 [Streptomyces sp. NPDC058611]|uniref:hypothetical protein n=1 Tax=unclassified Streptomyces TaxID=2593676 RepID=UPI0036475E61